MTNIEKLDEIRFQFQGALDSTCDDGKQMSEEILQYFEDIERALRLKDCYEKHTIPYLQDICHKQEELLLKLKGLKQHEIDLIDEVLNND